VAMNRDYERIKMVAKKVMNNQSLNGEPMHRTPDMIQYTSIDNFKSMSAIARRKLLATTTVVIKAFKAEEVIAVEESHVWENLQVDVKHKHQVIGMHYFTQS
jgi:hypothetical protein